jgi:hypothetical protein
MRWAGVALLAMVLSACSANADILEASTQGDERTLNLIVDTCNADLTTEVEESRSRVVVTLKARNDTSDDCLDGVVVHLDQPLGDRRLLDGGTGVWCRLSATIREERPPEPSRSADNVPYAYTAHPVDLVAT